MRWLLVLLLVPLVVAQPMDNGTGNSTDGSDAGGAVDAAAGPDDGGIEPILLARIVSLVAVAALLGAFVYFARR